MSARLDLHEGALYPRGFHYGRVRSANHIGEWYACLLLGRFGLFVASGKYDGSHRTIRFHWIHIPQEDPTS